MDSRMAKNQVEKQPPTKFLQDPTSHLMCPICGGLYRDPVINIKCGHTFCRACVFSATYCPVDNTHCDTTQIVANKLVVGQIEDLQIYCQHGLIKNDGTWELDPNSCSQILAFGKRNEHEKDCLFAPVPCPNSALCGKLRRNQLEEHKRVCAQTACKFQSLGCNFHGTLAKVTDHSKTCAFQNKGPNGNLAQKLQEQEIVIKSLEEKNETLTEKVSELEDTKIKMLSEIDRQSSLILKLQQSLEILSKRVDGLSSSLGKKRMSGSTSSLYESVSSGGTVRTNSLSSTRHSLSNPSMHNERWEMPFQFKCIGTLRGHKSVVWSLVTKKGRLYSASADGIIKIWSLDQLALGCVGNIEAHKGVIHCLATRGNSLISAGTDKTIKLWDLDTNELTSEIKNAHDNIICAMVILDDVLFTSSFSVIKVWDLKINELKASLTGASHWVRALAFSHSKDRLYSGSHNAIHVWDTKEDFHQLGSINHECGSVYSLATSRTYIIAGNSGTYNQNINVFSTESHEFIMNLTGHIGPVTTLVMSPSGRFLFSASHDSNIQMWGLEKLLPIQTLSRHQGSVNTLTLHGDFLLSGSEDYEVKVFRYFQIQ